MNDDYRLQQTHADGGGMGADWKKYGKLSVFYLVYYLIHLFLYEKGYTPGDVCASLESWVWIMCTFLAWNLALCTILTIYLRFGGSNQKLVGGLEKTHWLTLFVIIVWVIYSQFVIYNNDSIECRDT